MAKLKTTNIVTVAGKERILNVRRDMPDIRDRMYEPALVQLASEVDNRSLGNVVDQKTEGSCTGHGLAAVIDILYAQDGQEHFKSSRRMLYEMAKRHDKWPGQDYEGSSCRGAIRGWKNMGVCSEEDWPYVDGKPDDLTVNRGKAARRNTLGAYYRIRPEIADYHAAINEAGAIFVSARIHDGWIDLKGSRSKLAEIEMAGEPRGGHALAIVGYNANGFIVQNSWGRSWGSSGFALWPYLDWIENISDGWVFRRALPTPQIFGRRAKSAFVNEAEANKLAPRRNDILGHFVHLDNGKYEETGTYWSNAKYIEETADFIAKRAKDEDGGYKHLLIYAHGGLNDPKASANRVAELKEGFKRNGIYPFHIMYDTGLVKEVTDAVKRAFGDSDDKTKGFVDWITDQITDVTDNVIEDLIRSPVTPVWDEMKRDARLPFEAGDGIHTINTFATALKGTRMQIHLAGHSTGAVLLGHFLSAVDSLEQPDIIKSCSLMAPACTVDFYNKKYKPRLGNADASLTQLPKLNIYNLDEDLELDDNVVYAYRKSLLCLVSRALERVPEKKILGMKAYSKRLKAKGLTFFYSEEGKTKTTNSTSHGGFDNDPNTMNHIMKTILGTPPDKPFTEEEMKGY
ncbi:MAG: C1 family peptidase [Sneathiella sp.]|uniref:C1 family peptidase n=1 Tax=Sneathiella sp. TaxID=1964365 RepID=UPI0030020396